MKQGIFILVGIATLYSFSEGASQQQILNSSLLRVVQGNGSTHEAIELLKSNASAYIPYNLAVSPLNEALVHNRHDLVALMLWHLGKSEYIGDKEFKLLYQSYSLDQETKLLHLAAFYGCCSLADRLLHDPEYHRDYPNCDDEHALDIAVKQGYPLIVRAILLSPNFSSKNKEKSKNLFLEKIVIPRNQAAVRKLLLQDDIIKQQSRISDTNSFELVLKELVVEPTLATMRERLECIEHLVNHRQQLLEDETYLYFDSTQEPMPFFGGIQTKNARRL